ncbi:MAG TPA: 50S ribosomal protein L25 [Acidobacteriaceae bacterium]|nr:50S ribosomal protein L25 [Acidobacteriaceae bacterium]
MISQEVVSATPREGRFNKNAARRVRANGRIPAVVYGAAQPSVAIEVDPKQIMKILHSDAGHNSIFDLEINGSTAKTKAMIVDWQYEPIKGSLLHIDLKRIALDKVIRVEVPIQLIGIANGVKNQGGIMDQVLREIEIECLPGDIPGHIDVDVTEMSFGDVLRVADLPHSEKIKFLKDEDSTVAHVTAVKEEVAPTPEAVAAEAAAPAEPEVAKKGKQETAEAAPAPEKGAKK